MSYFRIKTDSVHRDESVILDFQTGEFGIAQAVFQSLATRSDYSQVTLYAIGAGGNVAIVADKTTFMEALRRAAGEQPPPFGRRPQ